MPQMNLIETYDILLSLIRRSILLLLTLSFPESQAQTNYSELYDSDLAIKTGIELYENEKFNEAILNFDKVIPIDPNYLTALYEKVLALIALKQDSLVKNIFNQLKESDQLKKSNNLMLQYANFLSDHNEFEESNRIFNEISQVTPDSYLLYFNWAVLNMRWKNNQRALDCLKKVITLNPAHAKAHYLLGALALEDGKIVEGIFGLLGYLVLTPEGGLAKDAVLILNKNMGDNYLEEPKLVYSDNGDNFSELAFVLRNKLSLNKKYKLKSDIDDVITRQVQAVIEYCVTHKTENGFFENIYVPWLAEIANKNYSEVFSYYMLASVKEGISKQLSSNKKEVDRFENDYLLKDFWDKFGVRELEHFGEKEKVSIFVKNGKPLIIGKNVDGKYQGKFKVVNEFGQRVSELNYVDNELDGKQSHFYDNNVLSEEVHYKRGVKSGAFFNYYNNGNRSIEGQFENNKITGIHNSYYPNGGKLCVVEVLNDERNGRSTCYHPNGIIKSEEHYLLGKLNGVARYYNEGGDLTSSYQYVNDLIEGDSKSFYKDSLLESEAKYVKGKVQGTYRHYYVDKTLEKEISFQNGKISKELNYYENGKLRSINTYSNEQIEKIEYYNPEGKLYFEESYKSGKLKKALQYSLMSPNPKEVLIDSDLYKIADLDGTVLASGKIENGLMTDNWTFYSFKNNLSVQQYYHFNKANGLRKEYDKYGNLESIYNSKEGIVNGVLEEMLNGMVTRRSQINDSINKGPYVYYYPNGKLSYEGFFSNGNPIIQKQYYQDGQLQSVKEFEGAQEIRFSSFNKDGSPLLNYENKHLNGTINHGKNSRLITESIDYVNGVKNGKVKVTLTNSSLISELNYTNHLLHGNCKYYSPNETLLSDVNYYCGKTHGNQTLYDLAGKIKYNYSSIMGKDYGISCRYYHNKSKACDYNNVNDLKEGEQTYYNLKGEPVVAIGFIYDVAKYYRVLDVNNRLGPPVLFKNGTCVITSKYSNKKIAARLILLKSSFDGLIEINSMEGLPVFKCSYKYGKLEGERVEYFSNGKIYKKERCQNGLFHGLTEYFEENGKELLKANYSFDELHGDFIIFKEGVKVKTKKYDSDELVEISK